MGTLARPRADTREAGDAAGLSAQVGVVVAPGGDRHAARRLADRLGVSVSPQAGVGPESPGDDGNLAVRFGPEGVALVGQGMELLPDLSTLDRRVAPGNLGRELVVKAARVRAAGEAPTAIDATAGLGEDSLLLAAAGFSITLYERDPVIVALLADALSRARARGDGRVACAARRMRLVEGDGVAALEAAARDEAAPDVVLLDPMFPGRTKSAAVKKKFQLLHVLERPCDDEEVLLGAALAARPRKVVVKRPVKGPWLAGRKPDYALCGKAVRFDVLVGRR